MYLSPEMLTDQTSDRKLQEIGIVANIQRLALSIMHKFSYMKINVMNNLVILY